MQQPLYLLDSYAKDLETSVKEIIEKDGKHFVVLDDTVFYARVGGQPSDTGKIIRLSDNSEFNVVSVTKFEGKIYMK